MLCHTWSHYKNFSIYQTLLLKLETGRYSYLFTISSHSVISLRMLFFHTSLLLTLFGGLCQVLQLEGGGASCFKGECSPVISLEGRVILKNRILLNQSSFFFLSTLGGQKQRYFNFSATKQPLRYLTKTSFLLIVTKQVLGPTKEHCSPPNFCLTM